MEVNLTTHEGETRQVSNMREKIKNCADTIIYNIDTMEHVYNEFGHDLDVAVAEKLSNIVWNELKYRL